MARTSLKRKASGEERVRTERVASPYGQHHGFDRVRRIVDTITAMYRRQQIDTRQKAAADLYHDAYRACPGSIPCALDQSRGVAGIPRSRSPTQAQLSAAERLAEAARILGLIDGEVVRRIAGEGQSVEEAADALSGAGRRATQRERHVVGVRLRMGLAALAGSWFPEERKGIRSSREEGAKPTSSTVVSITPGRVAHATSRRVYGLQKTG